MSESREVLLEILIPTYNRCAVLEKNLRHVSRLAAEERVQDKVRILVSDNGSPDETPRTVESAKKTSAVDIQFFRHETNLGLEENAFFLLKTARAPYVMYLGDDDFLPAGYLAFVLDRIEKDPSIACIIPGNEAVFPDGHTVDARKETFEERVYAPSYKSILTLSRLGHQLSGLVLRRAGLAEAYASRPDLRNIYLFIFFVGYNVSRGLSVYVPRYKIRVTEGASKDWSYDDSGLLLDIFRNYRLLFPDEYLKRNVGILYAAWRNPWRLRIGRNVVGAARAFLHLQASPELELVTRIGLVGVYAGHYARLAASKLGKTIGRWAAGSSS